MPGTFEPEAGFRAGGPHELAPGEWTDDTSTDEVVVDASSNSVSTKNKPKGTRIRQPLRYQRLTSFQKESMVTKRVPFGELFQFAEFRSTIRLTQNAEGESSRRFVFSQGCATTYVKSFRSREFSVRTRAMPLLATPAAIPPELSDSHFCPGFWVNNLVGFGLWTVAGVGRADRYPRLGVSSTQGHHTIRREK
jgi:hypothetical protein